MSERVAAVVELLAVASRGRRAERHKNDEGDSDEIRMCGQVGPQRLRKLLRGPTKSSELRN